MNIILLVTIIGIVFGAIALADRHERARGAFRTPLGSDLDRDRDAARLRTELDANLDSGADPRAAGPHHHRRAA